MVPPAPRYEDRRDFFVAIRLVRICHTGSLTLETRSVLAAALSVWSATHTLRLLQVARDPPGIAAANSTIRHNLDNVSELALYW
jgi:hypothetical protein